MANNQFSAETLALEKIVDNMANNQFSAETLALEKIVDNMANTSNQFSAETLTLEKIVDKITIYDKLYFQIYSIQPELAGKITAMLIDAMNKTDIQNLLNNRTILLNKINEAIAVLKNYQHNNYNIQQQRKTNFNAIKISQNRCSEILCTAS
eukprot:193394_1